MSQELEINTNGWDETELKCKKCNRRSTVSYSPGHPIPDNLPNCLCGANDYIKLKVIK